MLIMAVAAFAACLVALLWWQAEPAYSATTALKGFTDSLVARVNNPTSMALAPRRSHLRSPEGRQAAGHKERPASKQAAPDGHH
jgi:hypothetical protein